MEKDAKEIICTELKKGIPVNLLQTYDKLLKYMFTGIWNDKTRSKTLNVSLED